MKFYSRATRHLLLFTVFIMCSTICFSQWNSTLQSPVLLGQSGSTISYADLNTKFNIQSTDGNSSNLSLLSNNPNAGYGLLNGGNVVSPVVWMYGPFSNAFTIAYSDYNASGTANVGTYLHPLFQVRSNGQVGIGTTAPTQKLEVNGSIFQNAENTALGIDAQAAARLGFIKQYGRGPVIASDVTSPIVFAQSDQTGIYTNISGATLTERMRIATNGNVGIGTTSPTAKLHVAGIGVSLNVSDLFSGNLIVQANTGGRNSTMGAQLEFVIPANTDGTNLWGQARIITVAGNGNNYDASGKMILGTRRNYNKIGTGNVWYYGDDLTIDSNGNIGIGNTSPDAKLAVKGQVHAQEVKVDLQGAVAPDYVFEKDYALPTLEQVKSYIETNKHLPDVPSAKEMEKNGVNLGEMNMILLKKMEEMTLYMIEQDKKIQMLTEKINNK